MKNLFDSIDKLFYLPVPGYVVGIFFIIIVMLAYLAINNFDGVKTRRIDALSKANKKLKGLLKQQIEANCSVKDQFLDLQQVNLYLKNENADLKAECSQMITKYDDLLSEQEKVFIDGWKSGKAHILKKMGNAVLSGKVV